MKRQWLSASISIILGAVSTLTWAAEPAWQVMQVPEEAAGAGLRDVWGTSETNIYCVGSNGTILHYDGDGDNDGQPDDKWEQMSSPTTEFLTGIWGSSDTSIWVVGSNGTILHGPDGGGWQTVPDISSNLGFNAISGSGSGNIYAVGERASGGGCILRYNGDSWTDEHGPIWGPIDGPLQFNDVWTSGTNDILVIGHNGRGNPEGVCYKYDGSDWTWGWRETGWPQTRSYYGVCQTGAGLFIAAQSTGMAGQVLCRTSGSWVSENIAESDGLYDIWPFASDDVYVCSYHGGIFHSNGSEWSPSYSCTSTISRLWASDNGVLYAVGSYGKIVRLRTRPIEASIDLDPDTFNIGRQGQWVTCYITLPQEYDPADIRVDSIRLQGEIAPDKSMLDSDRQVLVAKFSSSALRDLLVELGWTNGTVELTVAGELTDGSRFEGTGTIRVIDPPKKK